MQSKDFIVKDFIEGLSAASLAAHRRSGIQANGINNPGFPYSSLVL